MGCWNATCMISGLPILCGDQVVCIFLRGGVINWDVVTGGSYPTDFWNPVGLPIRGEYDDYGRVEKIQPGYEKTLECLLGSICHSKYVEEGKSLPTTIKEVVEQAERGYLGWKKKEQLGLALIRSEVWDYAKQAGLDFKGFDMSYISRRKLLWDRAKQAGLDPCWFGSGSNEYDQAIMCGANIDEIMEIGGVSLFLTIMRKRWDVPGSRGSQMSEFDFHASFHEFVTSVAIVCQKEESEE